MRDILSMDDLDLKGKRVFLRADINSPISPVDGSLIESTRLHNIAVTINDLRSSKVIMGSHQGRVGKPDYVSLERHAAILSGILGRKVKFVSDVFGPAALDAIGSVKEGEVLMLDNLRFAAEENLGFIPGEAEKTVFVQKLLPHIDACVLDCFSAAHRSHPSIVGFAELVPTCAGRMTLRELKALDRIFPVQKKPYVVVMGGAKLKERMETVEALIENDKVDRVLLAGMMAPLFLKAAGKYDGTADEAMLDTAKRLVKSRPGLYMMPVDVAVDADGERVELPAQNVPPDMEIMDIGSETIDAYSRMIKGAGTVFMTGPAGAFEVPRFRQGTDDLLAAMAGSLGTTVVSGGHLSSEAMRTGVQDSIDHVSTAGGALVQYLSGKRMPLIDALERAAKKWRRKSGK